MQTSKTEARAESIVGISAVLTMIGVLGFVFFPLAIPIVVLTGVFAAPLLLPAIPLLLLVPLVLAARGVLRRLTSRTGGSVTRRPARAASFSARAPGDA